MRITFTEEGWKEYTEWLKTDKKTSKKINSLLKSIQRMGAMEGIGKPEVLKHLNSYSRRIDGKNRLVYKMNAESVVVISCKGHYVDK